MKNFAFTLDLEADYAGVVDQYEIFKDLNKIEQLVSTLNSRDVKITVFAVGEILELFPGVIKVLKKYNCEFEAHSYSHDFKDPDSEFEIEKSKNAYLDFFKKYPSGYRAPRGMISETGIKLLEKHRFLYDSSIFPSYFPNPFKYLFKDRQVHYYGGSSIMEIPFTVVTPFKLTLSISYIKLFGLDFFKKVSLPDTVCFGSHLHDFIINEHSFNKLPLFQKLMYSRNKYKEIDFCVDFLEHVRQKGYRFCYMSEIYGMYENK